MGDSIDSRFVVRGTLGFNGSPSLNLAIRNDVTGDSIATGVVCVVVEPIVAKHVTNSVGDSTRLVDGRFAFCRKGNAWVQWVAVIEPSHQKRRYRRLHCNPLLSSFHEVPDRQIAEGCKPKTTVASVIGWRAIIDAVDTI